MFPLYRHFEKFIFHISEIWIVRTKKVKTTSFEIHTHYENSWVFPILNLKLV